MKYDNYSGEIKELINIKIKEIEEKENVKILHAVESGSRAWGFESKDSDYDVRFIYVRPKEYYLKLESTKDIIDWELNDTLDINGWDLNKALRLFYKSNSTVFEWANSPVIYTTTEEWKDIYNVAKNYFYAKGSMYQYYGTAKHNFYEYLQDDYVKYKKYFYVIRPLLACKWIEKHNSPPPVLFNDLINVIDDYDVKKIIFELLEIKKGMSEADKGKRIEELNNFIKNELEYYEKYIKNYNEERVLSWDKLNDVFLKTMWSVI